LYIDQKSKVIPTSGIIYIQFKRIPKGQSKNDVQSRETGNVGEEKHNTICVGHHYAQTNTNNVT